MSLEKCKHGKTFIEGYICKQCSTEIALAIKDGFLKVMDKQDIKTLGDTIENIAKKMGLKK